MAQITRLSSTDNSFQDTLDKLLAFDDTQDEALNAAVVDILADIKKRGDEALLDCTRRFDHRQAGAIAELELPRDQLRHALQSLPKDQRKALELAAGRVRIYHEKQVAQSWSYAEPDGTRLGQKITPLDRVGLYV